MRLCLHRTPRAAAEAPGRSSINLAGMPDCVAAHVHSERAAADRYASAPHPLSPPRHEWWTRRIALSLGGLCVASGGIVLAHASMLQTPLGAVLLYAYEQEQRPGAKSSDAATLHDWAIAQGIALGVQGGALGLIAVGFGLAIFAVH